MPPETDVKTHFTRNSNRYYADVHGRLIETYRNVGEVLNQCLWGTVLDIGNGGVFFYDTEVLEKVIAVDVAYPKQMQNTEKITFYSGDARDLSFLGDQKVDCVLMQFLLHHVIEKTSKQTDETLLRIFAEAYKALNSEGQLIIVEPVLGPIVEFFQNAFYRFGAFVLGLFHKPMVRFYCPTTLTARLKQSGFHAIERRKIELGKEWIPFAPALFPGKFVLPAWLYPMPFCCFKASKSASQHSASHLSSENPAARRSS